MLMSMDIQSKIWKKSDLLITRLPDLNSNWSNLQIAEWIDFLLAVTIWIDFELTAFHIWDFRTDLETRVNIEASSVYKSPSILSNFFSEPNDADEVDHFHRISHQPKKSS